MNIRSFLLLLALISTFAVAACQRAEQKTAASADAKRYELTGKVVSVDQKNRKAKIEHDEIPGYMPAMTMDFPIKQDWVVRELKPNDRIAGVMVVEPNSNYYLDEVGIMSAGRDEGTESVSESGQKLVSVEVPNFQLVNQDGKKIGTSDFRGKNLLVTFIFTRCPDADMCPYMSISFSDLAKQLEKSPELADNTRLLSVTFDPQYDTPKVLREYGAAYFGKGVKPNFELWQLATGTEEEIKNITGFFGIMAQKGDGTNIIHNLRTILINPEGKIAKVYVGNAWKKEDILRDLQMMK